MKNILTVEVNSKILIHDPAKSEKTFTQLTTSSDAL